VTKEKNQDQLESTIKLTNLEFGNSLRLQHLD
jgi:hypothetical protein